MNQILKNKYGAKTNQGISKGESILRSFNPVTCSALHKNTNTVLAICSSSELSQPKDD